MEVKKKSGAAGYVKISNCYVHVCGIFATVTVFLGTDWVP